MKKLYLLTFLLITTISFSQTSDLYFSMYGEGSADNVWLEIYNGTGSSVDLSNYSVAVYPNGMATAFETQALSGTIANNDVFVIYKTGADSGITSNGDLASDVCIYINGDDAIALIKTGSIIDIIGTIGSDPGNAWNVGSTFEGARNHTLVRKSTVCDPNSTGSDSFGTDDISSEWTVYPVNTEFGQIGSHTACAAPGESVVFQESFETGNSGTTSRTCNDGNHDFFTRTDGTNIGNSGTEYTVSGGDGSYFFAAQDLNAPECGDTGTETETLTFTGIDISTYTNLTFALLIAEDDSGDGLEDWDVNSSVLIEVNIDGAGYTNLLQFAASGGNNTAPGLDTNFDGTGDSTILTPTFQEFTASIGSGNSADIRITFANLDSADEDIAIDNLRIINNFNLSNKSNQIEGFSLYPNPTNKTFVTITSKSHETMNISVYDVLGKEVINSRINNKQLDVSNLNPGVYILRAEQNNAFTTRKLVIK